MRKVGVLNREKGLFGPWKVGAAALALTATMSLASCAEETGGQGGGQGNTQGNAQGGATQGGAATTGGSTMMGTTGGTTGGTTVAGTTMDGTTGTTMSGGTTGGTGGTTMQGGTTQGDAITSAQGLFVQNPQSLVGQEVRIPNATVQDVVGDSTFFVGPGVDQTVLAALEGELSGSQGEQAVDINPGQQVQITGTVEQLPSTRGLARFGLNQAEIQGLQNQEVYLSISQAEVAGQ